MRLKGLLLAILLSLSLLPLLSSLVFHAQSEYQISGIPLDTLKCTFYWPSTHSLILVGYSKADLVIYDLGTAQCINLGSGEVSFVSQGENSLLIGLSYVVNGTSRTSIAVIGSDFSLKSEINVLGSPIYAFDQGNYVAVVLNRSGLIYLTYYQGKSSTQTLSIELTTGWSSSAGALSFNSSTQSTDLLLWYYQGRNLYLQLYQLVTFNGVVIAPSLIASYGPFNGGYISIIRQQGYNVLLGINSDQGPYALLLGNITRILPLSQYFSYIKDVQFYDGNIYAIGTQPSSFVIYSRNSTFVLNLSFQGTLLLPAPYSSIWILGPSKEAVISSNLTYLDSNFTPSLVLNYTDGVGYLFSNLTGEMYELNLYTGKVIGSYTVQGQLEGSSWSDHGIYVVTGSEKGVEVYQFPYVSSFITTLTLTGISGNWTLRLGELWIRETSPEVTLQLPLSEYQFEVISPPGYSNYSGTILPNQSTVSIGIFPLSFRVLVISEGLPRGVSWGADVGKFNYTSNSSILNLSLPLGNYSLRIYPPLYYNYTVKEIFPFAKLNPSTLEVLPSYTSYDLNGISENASVVLIVLFTEQQFPLVIYSSGYNSTWTMFLNGSAINITSNPMVIRLYPGVYDVSIPMSGLNVSYPRLVSIPQDSKLNVTFKRELNLNGNSTERTGTNSSSPNISNTTSGEVYADTLIGPMTQEDLFLYKVISFVIVVSISVLVAIKVK